MPIESFSDKRPSVGSRVFVASTATIVGDVCLGAGVNVWYGAVLRGDVERVAIGSGRDIALDSARGTDTTTTHCSVERPGAPRAPKAENHNLVEQGRPPQHWGAPRRCLGVLPCLLPRMSPGSFAGESGSSSLPVEAAL